MSARPRAPIRGAAFARPPMRAELPRADPVLQGADEHEEGPGGEAVAQHLYHRAVPPRGLQGIDADEDEAQVAHARIGDEPLHVRPGRGP